MVANGAVHRVSNSAGSSGFTTVVAAIQAAAPGALILIDDAGPYQASSVMDVDKAMTLIGAAGDAALATPTPTLARLRGNRPADATRNTAGWVPAAHGVIRIRGVTRGMVALANLHIEDGADRQGGGVFVDEVHRVWVHNCVFSRNVAYAGGWLFEGFGGAVCARHSGILIDKCLFNNNEANGRGEAVGVFGYGWPIIEQCRFENNRSERLNIVNPATTQPSFRARMAAP